MYVSFVEFLNHVNPSIVGKLEVQKIIPLKSGRTFIAKNYFTIILHCLNNHKMMQTWLEWVHETGETKIDIYKYIITYEDIMYWSFWGSKSYSFSISDETKHQVSYFGGRWKKSQEFFSDGEEVNNTQLYETPSRRWTFFEYIIHFIFKQTV